MTDGDTASAPAAGQRVEPVAGEPVTIELTYRSPGAFLVAYTTNLVKGGLFVPVENTAALPAGTPVALRLMAPPATVVVADGVVTTVRAASAGPGQPAGVGVALTAPAEALGDAIDRVAFGFGGLQVLLGAGEAAPRAILTRYLRSLLTCEIIDIDYQTGPTVELGRIDLAVIDLDSSGAHGMELFDRLRSHTRAASAPVVALAQMERDRTRALRLGFDEALPNPPSFPDLQAAVLRTLGRPVLMRL